MKKLSTHLTLGILGMAGTLGILSLQSAVAQTSPRDANVYSNTQSGDRPSSGFGSGSSGMGSMFDLFHRAVLGTPRSSSEFGQEQQNSLGSEASDFPPASARITASAAGQSSDRASSHAHTRSYASPRQVKPEMGTV